LGGLAGGPAPALGPAGTTGAGTASGKVGHQLTGTVESVDAKAGTATIAHGPVASLKWPAMTMEFALSNPSQLAGVNPGSTIAFEIVERKPGEWVITKAQPVAASNAASRPAASASKPAPAGHSH
jgi:Cu/Ag efflux protein CusF